MAANICEQSEFSDLAPSSFILYCVTKSTYLCGVYIVYNLPIFIHFSGLYRRHSCRVPLGCRGLHSIQYGCEQARSTSVLGDASFLNVHP